MMSTIVTYEVVLIQFGSYYEQTTTSNSSAPLACITWFDPKHTNVVLISQITLSLTGWCSYIVLIRLDYTVTDLLELLEFIKLEVDSDTLKHKAFCAYFHSVMVTLMRIYFLLHIDGCSCSNKYCSSLSYYQSIQSVM